MANLYAGLDVSQESTSICVVDAKGRSILETVSPSDPAAIAAALKPYRRILGKVGHETGIFSPWLHKELVKLRFPVVCLDARRTRAALAAQRNKTDRNDARDIAIALSRGFNGTAFVKSDEAHRMRMLMAYRRALKRRGRDLEACLRTTLKVFGAQLVKRKGEVTVKQLPRRRDRFVADITKTMLRARQSLLSEAKTLDDLVKKIAFTNPVCRRLMTVPGVGPVTALTFWAAIDDPARFQSSRLVGAHFGLTPRRFQSGQRDSNGPISRSGDHEVRSSLYEAASTLLACTKAPSSLREWGVKLRARKGFKFACVACARKLAVVLHRIWVTEQDFQPYPKR